MPLSPDTVALVQRYWALFDVELRRIGITDEDQWVLSGGGSREPTESTLQAYLQWLRSISDGIGARAYCELQGIDYDELKRVHDETGA